MLRLAVSVKTGAILPSDILRRLSSHSRKNKLYFALRELWRVVRSIFLLRFVSDMELRHMIQTATFPRSSSNHIGSVDPDAFEIPARKGGIYTNGKRSPSISR